MTDAPATLVETAAVVLNWNNLVDTARCVEALLESGHRALRVILVDNHSTDGSCEALAGRFPQVELIRNAANLGFAAGCNVGLRLALQRPECRYVLLVNNDCIVGRDSIGAAVAAAQGDPAIGVVTGKIVDDKGRIWHAGGSISLLRGQAVARGFRAPDRGQFDAACDTQWASGAMMLIRREVAERTGGLPEAYFFGVEEWDFSLEVPRLGYRIRYVPRFAGMHPGGGSHDNHDPKFAYNYYRNKLLFQERHLGPLLFPLWRVAFRLYLRLRMRRHIAFLASIHYADPSERAVDEVVFAARTALRDHGRNRLSEATMLEFERVLREWRERRGRPGGTGTTAGGESE